MFNNDNLENKNLEHNSDVKEKDRYNTPEAVKIPQKATSSQGLFEWLDMIIAAIVAVVIIFSLFFRIATIDGPSMNNTLHHGDKIIISNFTYTPKQGDIVVISRNKNNSVNNANVSDAPIIKRVIAVEGQIVDIDFEKGTVSVDGVELKEDYVNTPTNLKYDITFPVYVPEGCVFVLGDNRNNSIDSRSSSIGEEGFIDTRYILGKAVFRLFPFNKIGGIE